MFLIDYYNELGLTADATMDDLKKAFRQKAKQYHPDINPAPTAKETFIRIHTAYEMVKAHLQGKIRPAAYDDLVAEAEKRKQQAAERAKHYARMRYEKFKKEWDSYHTPPYSWLFKTLYYGLFYLYLFCAMVFAFVPLWAGIDGGIFYFIICLPLYVVAYFTVSMAYGWKKDIDPLFS